MDHTLALLRSKAKTSSVPVFGALFLLALIIFFSGQKSGLLSPLFILIIVYTAIHLSYFITVGISTLASLLNLAIMVHSRETPFFLHWSVQTLVFMAVGVFVNRHVEKMRRIQHHQQEIQALSEISASLTTTLKLNEITNMVVDHIFSLFDADGCTIFLLDGESKELHPITAKEKRNDPEIMVQILKNRVRVGFGCVGWVASTGQTMLSGDAERDPRAVHIPGTPFDDESVIGVPLLSKSEVFGVLWIYKFGLNAFDAGHLKLATIFANQVSVALANARLYENVRLMSETDYLTGLANSRCLSTITNNLITQTDKTGTKLSMFFLDCDDFKSVNDMYGHPFGDQFIAFFAQVLRESVRENDIVIRYAGDEFVILLPDTGKDGALALAGRLLEQIRTRRMKNKPDLSTTVSIGLATYPDQASTAEELITHADDALYQAKKSGKNRLVVYDKVAEQLTKVNA